MPLFTQPITEAQRIAWLTRINPIGLHLVSPWPRHVSPRSSCAFRLKYTKRNAFSPLRWFCHWDTSDFGGPEQLDGYIDLSPLGPGVLEGVSGVSAQGYQIVLTVSSLEVLPLTGNPGINVLVKIVRISDGAYFYDSRDYDWETPEEYRVPIRTDTSTHSASEDGFSGLFGWTVNNLYCQGVGSCYDFGQVIPSGPGFAEFNGVDAWIQLDSAIPLQGFNYDYEYDIRMQGNDMVMLGTLGAGRPYTRILNGTYYNGDFHAYPLSPAPAVGVWTKVRQEWRGPEGPTAMKIYVDDVLAAQGFGASQQYGGFDMLGRYNAGAFNIWGHADMRDVKLTYYSGSGPVVDLDMPLRENACDLSPAGNNGTTFNMPIPSCP